MSTKFDSLYAPPKAFDQFGNFIPMDRQLLDWLNENRSNAQSYLRLNKGFKDAEVCKAILLGADDVAIARKSGLSTVRIKKLRRQGKEQVANHTTIQPRWGFRTNNPQDKSLEQQADILTKRLNVWFFDQFVDKAIEAALTNTEGSGTGYLFLWPEKSVLTGKIDIIPFPLDYKDVLVFHYPKDSNYQNSYGIEVRLEMAVPEAHEKFPRHVDIINKDRNVPSTIARAFKRVSRPFRGVVDRMAQNKKKTKGIATFPTVDIFFTWIRDAAINTSGKDIQMGAVDTVYSYSVPSYTDIYGQVNQVGTGIFIDEKDDVTLETKSIEQMRDLTPDECKFYPNRRLIISCSGGVLYDGAPLWGANLVPVVPFKFEEVNGELLGLSPLNDGREIENAANSLVRSIIDSTLVRKSPPIAIDSSAPKEMKGENFSINKPNQKFTYDLRMLQTPLKVLVPPEHYQIDPAAAELIKMLFGMQDYLVGTSDWQQAAAQNKQMPAQDTQESLIRALGVLATSQSRSIEKSLLMLGLIWMQFFPQVYDTRELLNVLGKDGVDWQQFDYDPNSLVPKKEGDSRPFHIRCREHLNNFSFFAQPNSLQEKQSITNRLALLQVKNAGVKISGKKIYDAFVNDGEYDKSVEEFRKEQEDDIKMAAKLNAEIKAAQDAIQNPVTSAVQGVLGQGQNKEGRPPSETALANLQQKKDENNVPRTTLATS